MPEPSGRFLEDAMTDEPKLNPAQIAARRRAEERRARERAASGQPLEPLALPVPIAPEPDPELPPAADRDADSPVDPDLARRRQLLQGVPDDIASLISDEELAKIEAEERAKAESESKKLALSLVRDQMRQRARVEANLIPADVLRSEAEKARLAELVTFRINLPDGGTGGLPGPRIDGRIYQNGMVYTEPRAVFDSLQEMHYRVHVNEVEFLDLNQMNVFRRGDDVRTRPAQIILARRPPPFEVIANA
jgi:hypothetical protein